MTVHLKKKKTTGEVYEGGGKKNGSRGKISQLSGGPGGATAELFLHDVFEKSKSKSLLKRKREEKAASGRDLMETGETGNVQ